MLEPSKSMSATGRGTLCASISTWFTFLATLNTCTPNRGCSVSQQHSATCGCICTDPHSWCVLHDYFDEVVTAERLADFFILAFNSASPLDNATLDCIIDQSDKTAPRYETKQPLVDLRVPRPITIGPRHKFSFLFGYTRGQFGCRWVILEAPYAPLQERNNAFAGFSHMLGHDFEHAWKVKSILCPEPSRPLHWVNSSPTPTLSSNSFNDGALTSVFVDSPLFEKQLRLHKHHRSFA